MMQERIEKAVTLYKDGTWNENHLVAALADIIKDVENEQAVYKQALEKLLVKIEGVRRMQREYWSGYRKILSQCKAAEVEIDQVCIKVRLIKGVNTERFERKSEQEKLF